MLSPTSGPSARMPSVRRPFPPPPAGVVAYRTPLSERRQLTWFDSSGKRMGTLGEPDAAGPAALRISPDGRTVALERSVNRNVDVWLIETARGVLRRLTSDPLVDGEQAWSPDGQRIAFHSRRSGPQNLWVRSIDGGPEEHLLESTENERPTDWSPDG